MSKSILCAIGIHKMVLVPTSVFVMSDYYQCSRCAQLFRHVPNVGYFKESK